MAGRAGGGSSGSTSAAPVSSTPGAVKELQAQLRAMTAERDQLRAALTAAQDDGGGDGFFSGGFLMSEQLLGLQKEVQEGKAALTAARDEVAALQKDLGAAKAAQHAMESAITGLKQQLAAAHNDKEYLQASAARSVAEVQARDIELEAARQQLANAEVALGKAEAQAAAEGRGRREAEAALSHRQQLLAALRGELETRRSAEAAATRHAATLKDAVHRLEASLASTQAKLDAAASEVERATATARAAREAEGRLRMELQASQALAAQLQGTSTGQAEQITSLTAKLQALQASSDACIARLTSDNQLLGKQAAEAQEQATELAQELRQARQDVAAAEARLSEARQLEHQQRTGTVVCGVASANSSFTRPHNPHAQAQHHLQQQSADGGAPDADNLDAANDAQHISDEPHDEAACDAAQDAEEAAAAAAAAAAAVAAAAAANDAADAAEQLAILRTMVHDLKLRLAQATQEKVEALLAMAELKQAAQGTAGGDNGGLPAAAAAAAAGASTGSNYGAGLASFVTARFGWRGSGRQAAHAATVVHSQAQPLNASGSTPVQHAVQTAADVQSSVTHPPETAPPSLQQQQQQQQQSTTQAGVASGGAQAIAPVPAASAALVSGLQQLVREASDYLSALQAAARCILSADNDPASKWSALAGLSQVHVRLNHTRGRKGLDKPPPLLLAPETAAGAAARSGIANGALSGAALERQLTAQVLDLVDLGLALLDACHRQQALSSVSLA